MSDMVKRVAEAIDAADLDGIWSHEEPYQKLARAAIAAMRVPTEEMRKAARDEAAYGGDFLDQWQAMVNAALNPGTFPGTDKKAVGASD